MQKYDQVWDLQWDFLIHNMVHFYVRITGYLDIYVVLLLLT